MSNSGSFTSEFNPNLNKVYLHLDSTVILVDQDSVSNYLKLGWQYGKSDSRRCYVNKDGKYLRIDRDKLLDYLEEGWKYGASGKPRNKK